MKRVISIIACAALVSCLCLTGCGQQNKVAAHDGSKSAYQASLYDIQNLTTPCEFQGVSLMINPDWVKSSETSTHLYIKTTESGPSFMLHTGLYEQGNNLENVWAVFYPSDTSTPQELKSWTADGIEYTEGIVRQSASNYLLLVGTDTATGKSFDLCCTASKNDFPESDMNALFDGLIDTIVYDPSKTTIDHAPVQKAETDTTPPASSTNNTPAAQPAKPTATVSQQNALKMANSYLKSMPFSYTGLIEQLEYEQFSTEDATYGADNCGADWNEQAAKMAASYLSTMSFSRGGLIDQLMFEGFTEEQATYGADSVGL